MSVSTYSPSDVSVIYGLKHINGFTDGSFITIHRETPLFSHQRSMDGKVALSMQRFSTYTVTLTLSQTSDSNQFLHSLQKLMMKSLTKLDSTSPFSGLSSLSGIKTTVSNVISKLPFIIRDGSGNSVFFARDVWLDTEPDVVYSAGMESRVWTIKCLNATNSIAGNGEDDLLAELAGIGAIAESVTGIIGGLI